MCKSVVSVFDFVVFGRKQNSTASIYRKRITYDSRNDAATRWRHHI